MRLSKQKRRRAICPKKRMHITHKQNPQKVHYREHINAVPQLEGIFIPARRVK